MNALEMVLVLILIRLVIPFGMLLMIGEWIHNYERDHLVRM